MEFHGFDVEVINNLITSNYTYKRGQRLQQVCVFLCIFTAAEFHGTINMQAMWRILPGFFVLLMLVSCERQEPDTRTLLEKLNDLPGVKAFAVEPVYGYTNQFRLEIHQPVDHANPDGAAFIQEAHLHHVYCCNRNSRSRLR